jgi:hypothetical protein
MKAFVLVYNEHYGKFCEVHSLSDTQESFQRFLKEIGTPSVQFQSVITMEESNYMGYKEVPEGTCLRLRQPHEYVAVVHEKLFQTSREKEDKSRRGSSCVIV